MRKPSWNCRLLMFFQWKISAVWNCFLVSMKDNRQVMCQSDVSHPHHHPRNYMKDFYHVWNDLVFISSWPCFLMLYFTNALLLMLLIIPISLSDGWLLCCIKIVVKIFFWLYSSLKSSWLCVHYHANAVPLAQSRKPERAVGVCFVCHCSTLLYSVV